MTRTVWSLRDAVGGPFWVGVVRQGADFEPGQEQQGLQALREDVLREGVAEGEEREELRRGV